MIILDFLCYGKLERTVTERNKEGSRTKEYTLTDAELFEALGKDSTHHCEDCAFRGDGEEIDDFTYCWQHGMTIRLEWFCNEWEEPECTMK